MIPLSRRQFMARTIAGTSLLAIGDLARLQAEDKPTHSLNVMKWKAAPDGFERDIWGLDKQLPGPVIRAKEGEEIRVRVVNKLGTGTTIHWHGMHQPGTWKMDGVAGVTQEPIPNGEEFTYAFKVEPAGTHWYHSHTGMQYGDGVFGPLIIAEKEPIAKYDREEIIMMHDWFHKDGNALLAEVVKGMGDGMDMKMDMPMKKPMDNPYGDVPFKSGLINGKGRGPDGKGPITTITVKKGEKIRLHSPINSSSTYALRFQIDNHPLTLVASDGPALQPVKVDNLTIMLGERYDAILEADKPGVYWIRAITGNGNEIRAVLRYRDVERKGAERIGRQMGSQGIEV